jgi:hypothetical protein
MPTLPDVIGKHEWVVTLYYLENSDYFDSVRLRADTQQEALLFATHHFDEEPH